MRDSGEQEGPNPNRRGSLPTFAAAVTAGLLVLGACSGSDAKDPRTTETPDIVETPTPKKGDISDLIGDQASETAQDAVDLMESHDIDRLPEAESQTGEEALHYQAEYHLEEDGVEQEGVVDIVIHLPELDDDLTAENISYMRVGRTDGTEITGVQGETFEYIKFGEPTAIAPSVAEESWGLDVYPLPFTSIDDMKRFGGQNHGGDVDAFMAQADRLDDFIDSLGDAQLSPAP